MLCENCGKDHDGSFGSGRFCNISCSQKYSRSFCDDDVLKDARCCKCGKEHKIKYRASEKLTACIECRYKQLKINNKYKPKPKREKIYLYCEYCGNKRSRDTKRCCSNKCANLLKTREKFEAIERDNGIGHDCRPIKLYLIYKRGHQCCICGGFEWNNLPIPLVMDHINGRASDNRLENLRLVCGNCDMQLPTYKSKNKNSDRKRK